MLKKENLWIKKIRETNFFKFYFLFYISCEIKNKPYLGYIEKLKKPIELKGRVIKYKPVVKLSKKKSEMKGGGLEPKDFYVNYSYQIANNKPNEDPKFKYEKVLLGADKIFFGKKIKRNEKNSKKLVTRNYFPFVLFSNGSFGILFLDKTTNELKVYDYVRNPNKKITIEDFLKNKYFQDQIVILFQNLLMFKKLILVIK